MPRISVALVPILYFLVWVLSDAAVSSALKSRPQLADVNLLLPPKMTYPAEYRLQGTDGCFSWSWDHHDILAVLPEYDFRQCSTSALLKSIAPYNGRKESAVYATDLSTGIVIVCKVYIDILSRIQIFHNSLRIDLDELATLRVRAFDSEENVFSSLVGLQFMWRQKTKLGRLRHPLVHVPLKDSPQSDCRGLCGSLDVQVKLEDNGVFSDLYVVKGIEVGQENVSVHLIEPSFGHMHDEIVMTIVEAVTIDPPSPVFVLVGASFEYSLTATHGNISHVVSFPDDHHYWDAFNFSVALVRRFTGSTLAKKLGATTIIVGDLRLPSLVLQASSLQVVLPDTILLYIEPLTPSGSLVEGMTSNSSMVCWYVVSGRHYIIQVKVFSQKPGAEEIYVTEGDDIMIYDDHSELWNTLLPATDSVAVNKTTRIFEPFSCGLGKLMAAVSYSSELGGRLEVLEVVQEVIVCDEVQFSMGQFTGELNRILLPCAPGIGQELELRVTGGCAVASSDYKWFSSDMTIVSVSTSGIIKSKSPGRAIIKAVSIYDSLNYDEIVIEVTFPSSMVMLLNFPVEVLVGSHLQASVTLKAPDGSLFERCDSFSSSIKWKTESESFTITNTSDNSLVSGNPELQTLSVGPPCAWTYVHASSAGRTILHATLANEYQQLDQSFSGFTALATSLCIAAYKPLRVLQTSDGNQFGGYWFNLAETENFDELESLHSLYLVPGTSFDVKLHGGPEWWDHGVEFIETVETSNIKKSYLNAGVLVHQEHANYGIVYRINCETLGNFKLVFKRGNLIGDNHPLPAVSEVHMLLMCHLPSSIVLIADEPVNAPKVIQSAADIDRIEGRIRATPIIVANWQRHIIRFSAVGISDSGEIFGNSSSLQLNWKLIDCDGLAVWDEANSPAKTKSSWEKFLILQNSSGLCTVRATVLVFIDSVSNFGSVTPLDSQENALTDAAQLLIISSLRVNPGFSLLFFSKAVKLNLSILEGTCIMENLVNDSRIVKVFQPPQELKCLQLMLDPERLGMALVTVYDIGLAPSLAASSVVQVADIDWIKITSGEEISVMEGNLASISFVAGTNEGHPFDSSQYVYMKIFVHFEDQVVELVDNYELGDYDNGYVRAPNFTIRGRHLGFTTLYLSARQHSGREVSSQSIKLEVYSSPRVHPSEIFLVPGASYVLKVRGGPKFSAFVEFASMDDQTAKFQKLLGLISGISPGNATLIATFYKKGNLMICQAYAKIMVGVPSEAKLNVQSEALAVGRQMPIFPSLSEGNLFSFYGLCSNFKWTIEDEKVLIFDGAHHEQGVLTGIPVSAANEFGYAKALGRGEVGFLQVLQGLSPGKTDVTVTFFCDFVSSGSSYSESKLYSARISLSVVLDLSLALGSPITRILPADYSWSDLLHLSSNFHINGDTSNHRGTVTSSLLKECDEKIAGIQADVIFSGGVRRKEADTISFIQAKDRSTGKMEMAYCARVGKIGQIRIMAPNSMVLTLAIGAEVHLPVKFFDFLGNPFHEAYNVKFFEAETNHPNVVIIGNSSSEGEGRIHLKGKEHGKALVQVTSVNDPQKSDYLMIFVGAHLHPQNPVLPLGSHLNFSIKGLSGLAWGHWFSANGSVVCVDTFSGKAEAVAEGSTEVHYNSSDLKLHTTVTVFKLLTVHAPKEMLTNVPPYSVKGYFFPVKLADGYSHGYEATGDTEKFFDCEVEPPYVGFAKAWIDPFTGRLYCIFLPHPPEQLLRIAPDSADVRHGLAISIRASLLKDNSIADSASAIFLGGFSLLGADESSVQLNLTYPDKGHFIIVGNTDVKMKWHKGFKLSVTFVGGKDWKKGGSAVYEVIVHTGSILKDKLIITLPTTGQTMELEVHCKGRKTADTTTMISYLYYRLVVATLACCVCFLVILHYIPIPRI